MHGLSIPKSSRDHQWDCKIPSFVAAFLLLVFGLSAFAQSATTDISKLTLRQKVGQLMIWSFPGTDFSPYIRQNLTKYQPGALIVFRRNIKTPSQIAKFNVELQKLAGQYLAAPLFVMVDQEGGLVTRIRTKIPMPSALALSKMNDKAFVENYAKATADLLLQLGFNVNLAPVLDISNERKDSFIGNRAFGNDPDTVTEMTLSYSKGLSEGGLLPTAKHFPGHGGTLQDSHKTVPRKMSTLDQLKQRDLVPFEGFTSAEFPKAVMVAHLSLPKIDPSGIPATYSTLIIHGQLRDALDYQGLVITDDLEMGGASISKSIGERAVRAFLAGNDMLMLAGTQAHQHQAFEAVLQAVKSGRISMSRLNESVARILKAKSQIHRQPAIDYAKILAAFKKVDALSKTVLKKNFDVAAQGTPQNWPEVDRSSHVTVFSASYYFFRKFQSHFKGKTRLYLLNKNSLDEVRDELASSQADFSVFFASGQHTAHWLNSLSSDLRAKLVVVNTTNRGEIEHQSEYMAVFNINSYFTDSGTWLADLVNRPPANDDEIRTPASDETSQVAPPEANSN